MRGLKGAAFLKSGGLQIDDWTQLQNSWNPDAGWHLAAYSHRFSANNIWSLSGDRDHWAAEAARTVAAANLADAWDRVDAWMRPFSRSHSDAADAFNFTALNTPPVATIDDHSVRTNEWTRVQDWLSYSDNGDAAVQYQFFDSGSGPDSGYFKTSRDDRSPAETEITVAASDLGDVWIRGGQAGGSENMYVRAFDGTAWSEWDNFIFTTQPNNAPDVWINHPFSETSEWSHVGSWVSYSDHDGDAATHYQFRDDGLAPNSAILWTPDDSHHPAGTEITIAAADLGDVWVHRGEAGTADTMWVRAFDGTDWSGWEPIYFATDNSNVSYGVVITNVAVPLSSFTLVQLAQPGSDTFTFQPDVGKATIIDFDPSEDVIRFEDTSLADFAAVMANTTDDGHGNAIIAYDVDGAITLEGVTRAMLQASNFDFV